ncbi:uracil-DNA glycosylase [Halomarina halobia]|uniref:Type-4 uracil-DNA glycosylase n=1 Tax=Halomarina halobia TaxID=3033386 RepID=A0ABD6ADD9_9EURY|nr:uracil-DNA glycosylase [Halomarina sp. PSR21]
MTTQPSFESAFGNVLSTVPDEYFDRSRFVPATGSFDAEAVLVGEAPGAQEVERGEPFVGNAGRRLDSALEEVGVDRDSLYITNLVKVRPANNRDPRRAEIDAWWPVLEAELERVDPAVVAPLGNFATRELLSVDEGITDLHGRTFDRDGRTVVPVFHPAATLYDQSKRALLVEDLRTVAAEAGLG